MHRSTTLLVNCALMGGLLAGGCTWSGERNSLTTGGGSGGTGTPGGRGGNAGTGVRVDASITPSDDANCGQKDQPVTSLPPDLLIVQDKSGSMAHDQSDQDTCAGMPGCSKWDQLVPAINQSVAATQANVYWGLKFFPDPGNNACGVNNTVLVPNAPNNANAIATAIAGVGPGGRTPTRTAILNAATYLHGLTDQNPKYILLATDGLPNCMPGNASNTVSDANGAVQAITDTLTSGIPTFVVGIGNTGATATLTMMASAGGRATAAAPGYYQVSSTAELVAALSAISTSIISCDFNLGAAPPNPDNILVLGDGKTIAQDPTNGWSYGPGNTSLVFSGTTCTGLQNKTIQNVRVIYGCGGQIIVP